MDESALVKQRRTNPQLIGGFVERPAFLYGFQTALKQLQAVFRSRYGVSFELSPLNVEKSCMLSEQAAADNRRAIERDPCSKTASLQRPMRGPL